MKLLKKQYLFLLLSFVAGFSVMVVEFASVRTITPYVGSSVYTWTSVIGMVLLGLSIGNWTGGYFIDKNKSEKTLSIFLFLSSFFIILIPLLSKGLRFIVLLNLPILATVLLISLVLFLLPAICLGLLYPTILKLYSKDMERIGRHSGTISALWALGSILGTFMTGFYFIGRIGTSNTFITIAIILFLFAMLFLAPKKRPKTALILTILLFLSLAIITTFATKKEGENIISDSESNYYKIKVVDYAINNLIKTRILFLDFDSNSIESLNGSDLPIYTNIYPVFSVFKEKIDDIFLIGGGSYSIAKKFSKFYQDALITVSEIDPQVTKTAEVFFKLKNYPVKTVSEDGRSYLDKTEKKYDLIFEDAFNSFISLPWHLTTLEFNQLAKSRLNNDGIYAVNFISALEGENSNFFYSMLETFKKTYRNFYIFAYGKTKNEPQSIILVGVNSNNEIQDKELIQKIKNIKNGRFIASKFISKDSLKKASGAIILTDNFAPVEKLMRPLMKNYFPTYSKFYYSTL